MRNTDQRRTIKLRVRNRTHRICGVTRRKRRRTFAVGLFDAVMHVLTTGRETEINRRGQWREQPVVVTIPLPSLN